MPGPAMTLRVPVASTVTLALGLLGHVAFQDRGSVPGPLTLVLALGLVTLTWSALARVELRLPLLVVGVWLTQAEVHLATLLADGRGLGPRPGISALGHHVGDAVSGPVSAWSTGLSGWASPTQMLAMHALAGVAAAWWLRRGEAATWRLARRLLARIRDHAVLDVVVDRAPAPCLPPADDAVIATGVLVLTMNGRRGPPRP